MDVLLKSQQQVVPSVVTGQVLLFGVPKVAKVRVAHIEPTEGPEEYDEARNVLRIRCGRVQVPGSSSAEAEDDWLAAMSWQIDGGDARAVVYVPVDVDKAPPEEFKPPRTWREVSELYHPLTKGLETGDFVDLQSSLQKLGPLGWYGPGGLRADPWRAEQGQVFWEPLGWVWSALDVLRALEELVGALRTQDTNRLRQLFGPVRRFPAPNDGTPPEVTLAGLRFAAAPYKLRWLPKYDGRYQEYRTPYDPELVREGWAAVFDYYRTFLDPRLEVATSLSLECPGPFVSVRVDSLWEWAVAVFYATEVLRFRGVCQRRGCGKPVPLGRERWCSDECAAAGRKQRKREQERRTVKQAYEQATARLRNPRCSEYVPPGEERDRKRAALRDAMELADGSVERFWELAKPILARERLANNLLTDHAERTGKS